METVVRKDLRVAVRELCSRFPDEYWRRLDERREYPEEFVRAMNSSQREVFLRQLKESR